MFQIDQELQTEFIDPPVAAERDDGVHLALTHRRVHQRRVHRHGLHVLVPEPVLLLETERPQHRAIKASDRSTSPTAKSTCWIPLAGTSSSSLLPGLPAYRWAVERRFG